MKPTSQTAETHPAQTISTEARQTIAIGICGAIGGASVIEVFTSTWLHPAAQPTADPLALAGALVGVAATLFMRRYLRRLNEQPATVRFDSAEVTLLADTMPLSPMTWQPVPRSPFPHTALIAHQAPLAAPQRESLASGTCPHARGRLGRRTGRPTFRQTPNARRIPAQG